MQSSLFKFLGIGHTEASENSATAENEKKSPWSKFDDLPLEEKRQLYRCGTNFVTLKDIPSWTEYRKDNLYAIYRRKGKKPEKPSFAVNDLLNEKVSLWQGDITSLEVDAIVNAANNSLLGGGGVDGCIHRAAGSTLRKECAALNGCSTGDAKITSGHKLPAKYVIHTVGPFGKQEKPLRSCYKRCLGLVKKYGLRTVAFCCVSTGIYGYPIYDASCVALNTVRKWLEDGEKDGKKNAELVDRIIFCVFLGGDLEVYQSLLPRFFPSEDKYDQESEQEQEKDTDETETDSKEDERAENKPREDRKDKHSSKGNGKDDVKKGEEGKGKEVGVETRFQDSSENDRKNKQSLSGNEKEGFKKGEEAKEKESGDVEMRDESIKERVPDQPKPEESLDSREDITEFEPEKAVNKNGGQDTTKEKNLCDKQSLSGNEKEEVKTGEEAKEEKTGDVKMDKDEVPNQPRREGFRDSQGDITEVEPEKVVNQNVPSEGQDTTKEKKLCDKQSLSGNEKEEVKKRGEAKVKKVGGEPRAEESFENVRKDKHSLSENENEEVKNGEEANEEIADVEMRDESIKERVSDQPKLEECRDSQQDITDEPEEVVNQNVPSEGQDTTKKKKLCDKQSLSGNEKEEVKKREEAKVKKVGGEPRAEESSENVRKDKPSLSENEKEEVKNGEEAKEEIAVPSRSIRQHEANLERQLRETQQREENSRRQLSEMQQNSQRQLREMQQREGNLRRQLRDKDLEVRELELSLSSAQQTISEQQQQETCDWVISRDEIQMTNKCLGWGAWGSVYEGVYCGCTVAVKQMHDQIVSPHNIRLFEREMNIASKCRHPHLLQFIGATKDEGKPLLVTELMEKSLQALLDQRQLDETEIRVISLDVARAINYLHQKKPKPIIHRDVSSANVLLWQQGDQWRGKVSDYGTANFVQQTMTVCPGTPIYSAPEALTSNQTVKVDVYSFGVLLCHMCIRHPPDPTRRELQVVLMSNRALRGLVRRCLQTDPDARPTMQEIINELSRTV